MRIIYALPHSTVFKKFYNRDTSFDAVTWSDWRAVVDGFRLRFTGWYFDPLEEFPKTGHEAYPVLCVTCALVDAFSHYDGDEGWHNPKRYKEFLRELNHVFGTKLARTITTSRWTHGSWKDQILKDFAEVFYTGVRCSLHHHGDLAPFAGMSGTDTLAQEISDAGRSTCGTHSYPIVVFDPWIVRDELRTWLDTYCDDLRNDPSSDRAKRFRVRFKEDFGIIIPEPQESA